MEFGRLKVLYRQKWRLFLSRQQFGLLNANFGEYGNCYFVSLNDDDKCIYAPTNKTMRTFHSQSTPYRSTAASAARLHTCYYSMKIVYYLSEKNFHLQFHF